MTPETRHSWTRVRRDPGETLLHYVSYLTLGAVAVAAVAFAVVWETLSWSLAPLLVCAAIYLPAAIAVIRDILPGGGQQ